MGGCGLAVGGGGVPQGRVEEGPKYWPLIQGLLMHWDLDPFRCLAFMPSEDMRIGQ